MNDLEKNLRQETEKWLAKIRERRKTLQLKDELRAEYLKNMYAYISDSQHFLDKGDLIRSFEAVIWAWSILTLGLEFGVLKQVPTKNYSDRS